MTVVIVGGGVAGLTVARALHQAGRAFLLLDGARTRADRGLGLWGRSHAALAALGLQQLLDDRERSHFIPPAAYRSRRGDWLSRCSHASRNAQRVCTLREPELLAALREGLPEAQVRRGTGAIGAERTSEGELRLHLSDGGQVEPTVLVGADGADSLVRRALFPSAGVEARDTGFVAYGGTLDLRALPASLSFHEPLAFETLSGGARFALVPLPSGGCFWFATTPRGAVEENISDATTADGRHPTLAALHHIFREWHEPIGKVLLAAIRKEAEQASASSSSIRVDPLAEVKVRRWWDGRTVLVGDAAHALPINLAQGAALSIEGAFLLGQQLARLDVSSANEAELHDAFSAYQGQHERRVAQCRSVTAFTQMLASPKSELTEAARNMMRFVPQPLNGLVFDFFLDFSLGDFPASTRAHWPLDIHGGRTKAS
ncbi:hypothetical protein AB1Y20_009489 [Prymnesium parvum]|uniref:FAD-binding domain-containing protein n=1 Tax=Prymnesium parvum TaxID=97485 RepID=A0AB34K269_PRYPA